MTLKQTHFVAVTTLLLPFMAISESLGKLKSGERWVCTWATAQLLAPMTFPGGGPSWSGPPTQDSPRQQSVPQQQLGRRGNSPTVFNMPSSLEDQTVRMIVHAGLDGRRVRVNLSNAQGRPLVQIGSAHIALHKAGGAIVPGTDRAITFNGKPACVLLPGVLILSDSIDIEIPPLSDIAVSLYFPRETGMPTDHRLGLHTAYISKGNVAGQESRNYLKCGFKL
jgi:hypothetical protein